jgi:hypothetical protein
LCLFESRKEHGRNAADYHIAWWNLENLFVWWGAGTPPARSSKSTSKPQRGLPGPEPCSVPIGQAAAATSSSPRDTVRLPGRRWATSTSGCRKCTDRRHRCWRWGTSTTNPSTPPWFCVRSAPGSEPRSPRPGGAAAVASDVADHRRAGRQLLLRQPAEQVGPVPGQQEHGHRRRANQGRPATAPILKVLAMVNPGIYPLLRRARLTMRSPRPCRPRWSRP